MTITKRENATEKQQPEGEHVIDDKTSGPVDDDVKDKVAQEVATTKEDIKDGTTDPDVEAISDQLITDLKDSAGIDKGQSTYVDPDKTGQESAKGMTEAFSTTPRATGGNTPVVAKSLSTSDQDMCKKVVPDVVMFGDDLFKLLSKASSKSEGWMKSTKAFDTGKGCLVQITTQQRNPDGSYAVAEALSLVPGVKILEHRSKSTGEITGRTLVGKG